MLKGIGVFIASLVLSVVGLTAWAGDDTVYKSPNKIDFIKIEKASKDEKAGGLKHPGELDPQVLRRILSSIYINKKVILLRNIENRQLFNEGNVEFLTPYLVEALHRARDDQVVLVSYFTKDTKVVIQDDRLTIFRAYVKDDGLHIKFQKVYAKMLGDRTTMGAERVAQEAKSLLVSLDPQLGQNRISWDPQEIVFDLNYYKTGQVTAPKPEIGKSEATAPKAEEGKKTIRVRMKDLDQLKKDELITDQEYQKKKQEILKEL